jgi:enoyl-CoA hydratase
MEGTMVYKNLLLELRDGMAIVTINRPDKLNALNDETKTELEHCIPAVRSDAGVGVLIITGAGEKSFVAGTDIEELLPLDEYTGMEFSRRGQALFNMIEGLGKPVIAAVNGYALGGGCELALACHIRIASANAKFGQPEVALGIMPGFGGTQRLPAIVGKSRALEMILSGNHIDANEALKIGLVSAVVSREDLMPAAEKMARTILSKGRLAVRAALEAAGSIDRDTFNIGLDFESRLFGRCCGSEDSTEGITAFLGKRPPVFKNK